MSNHHDAAGLSVGPPHDPTGELRFAEIVGRLRILGYTDELLEEVEHLEPGDVALPLHLLGELVDRLGAALDPRLPDGRASS